jgi:hypothetical protein
VAEQPDITLAELETQLAKKKVTVGKSSISRFLRISPTQDMVNLNGNRSSAAPCRHRAGDQARFHRAGDLSAAPQWLQRAAVLDFQVPNHERARRRAGHRAGEAIRSPRDADRPDSSPRQLHRASIDELPQLFNVIRGEMSLVGPRPHALAHDGKYSGLIAEYAFRHHVKPGITGWAQIKGYRGETTVGQMQKRVDLDLWYIDNWSFGLDGAILARTCFEVMRGRMAY